LKALLFPERRKPPIGVGGLAMSRLSETLGSKPGNVRVGLLATTGAANPYYDGRLVSGGEDYVTLVLSDGKCMLITTNAIAWVYYR
jgi:hypothetical protein